MLTLLTTEHCTHKQKHNQIDQPGPADSNKYLFLNTCTVDSLSYASSSFHDSAVLYQIMGMQNH